MKFGSYYNLYPTIIGNRFKRLTGKSKMRIEKAFDFSV
ncbi:hypothetical protein LEP1GSC125_3302 [Leptospira mayottensis 200901122]|uniref:Uncharacterized protein n=1 Tax=Leptospira mayottensis 200901122 TaxID=1193010 RepID=A0AA87SYP8_9LEPT|nr:hypothetical protein LEP1GSC125_3302 [Leptospira mayottensis 200901122]